MSELESYLPQMKGVCVLQGGHVSPEKKCGEFLPYLKQMTPNFFQGLNLHILRKASPDHFLIYPNTTLGKILCSMLEAFKAACIYSL